MPIHSYPPSDFFIVFKEQLVWYFAAFLITCVAIFIIVKIYPSKRDLNKAMRRIIVIAILCFSIAAIIDLSKPRSQQFKAAMAREKAWRAAGGGDRYLKSSNDDENVIFMTTARVNLRERPTSDCRVIKVLDKNERVIIRQQKRNIGKWVFAETIDRRFSGYLHSDYLVSLSRRERARTFSVRAVLTLILRNILGILSMGGLISATIEVILAIFLYNKACSSLFANTVSAIAFWLTNEFFVKFVLFSSNSMLPWLTEFFISIFACFAIGTAIAVITRSILDRV